MDAGSPLVPAGSGMGDDLPGGPLLLTYPQAAQQLGVSVSKLKALVRAGDLTAVDVGERSKRVRRSDLIAYIDQLAPLS